MVRFFPPPLFSSFLLDTCVRTFARRVVQRASYATGRRKKHNVFELEKKKMMIITRLSHPRMGNSVWWRRDFFLLFFSSKCVRFFFAVESAKFHSSFLSFSSFFLLPQFPFFDRPQKKYVCYKT